MANTEPAATTTTALGSRHAVSAIDKQRAQLNKLFRDPSKPIFIPAAPQEKTIRPPREMMKNVQGSSAGAGSGEFHVYKANRRREYERIKLMEDQSQKVGFHRHFLSLLLTFCGISNFLRRQQRLNMKRRGGSAKKKLKQKPLRIGQKG